MCSKNALVSYGANVKNMLVKPKCWVIAYKFFIELLRWSVEYGITEVIVGT